MGVHSHTVEAEVDPSIVWERWTNVDLWPADDPSLEKAQLNGPRAKGALGWVKPKGGRQITFRIAEIDRKKLRFRTESKLLLATMCLEHAMDRPMDDEPDALQPRLPADPNAWVITHRVVIRGPFAALWDRLVGRAIADGLPTVVGNIVAASAV